MIRSKTTRIAALGLVLLLIGVQGSSAQSPRLVHIDTVAHPPIGEMSGLAKSDMSENVWWTHNDSGDEARLFALDSTGTVRVHPLQQRRYARGAGADTSEQPVWPGVRLETATHIDYEDIAVADSTLYVADFGNNLNQRRDLGIYVVPEPTLLADRTRPTKHIPIAYPDQENYPAAEPHFDAESLFMIDDRLHLLTKRREQEDGEIVGLQSGTTLYRLDSEHPHRVNTLTRVGEHDAIPAPTGASVSPSGDRLAVLSYEAVWIFPRPDDDTHWLSTEPRTIALSTDRLQQAEAIAWDDPQTLRITNEQRDVFVLLLSEGR